MNNGFIFATIAFLAWGVLPLYWKQLAQVPVFEILVHRIFWASIFAAAILAVQRNLRETLIRTFRGEHLKIFLVSSLLIGGNWYLYIWAVNSGQVLESSFGYFINPLMNVALGRFFLGERFNKAQSAALVLALIGVAIMTWSYGRLPWIALMLAGSFALYGLVRKKAPAGTVRGLFIESTILAPIALGFGIWFWSKGNAAFPSSIPSINLLLIGSGVATGIPLLAFGAAVSRMPLSAVGFMQYIAPTCQFLLAVFVFKEHFNNSTLLSFAFIWSGLLVYTGDLIRRTYHPKNARKSEEPGLKIEV